MSDCRYYKDGKCGKSKYPIWKCKPINANDFNSEFETFETFEDACSNTSTCGNRFVQITEKNIEDLRKGKMLMHDDGEYCTFVILKKDESHETED